MKAKGVRDNVSIRRKGEAVARGIDFFKILSLTEQAFVFSRSQYFYLIKAFCSLFADKRAVLSLSLLVSSAAVSDDLPFVQPLIFKSALICCGLAPKILIKILTIFPS